MRLYIVTANWGGGGPGGIAADLYRYASANGWKCRFAFGRGPIPDDVEKYKIGSDFYPFLHAASARIFDNAGFVGYKATKLLVEDIKRFNPDVINLHNPLRYTMNVQVLFDYFRQINIPVVWTLHDCWAFTGHCITGICENLKNGCGNCPNKKEYPESYLFDMSRRNLERKKNCFSNLDNLSLISPSSWLASVVSQTFLNQYELKVIPNGIDLDVFKPTKSTLRNDYNLKNKKIILTVAGEWSKNKGAKYFYELSKRFDQTYAFVMIGKNRDKELKQNDSIIHIEHTTDRIQLAQWYSEADVFVNPTMGDNFPTVNIEALACGTPVVTFDTGGSGESVGECGMVIPQENIDRMSEAIRKILLQRIDPKVCVERAQFYDKNTRYKDYIYRFTDLCKSVR